MCSFSGATGTSRVTMHITFLTRKSALIYRRGLRQRVASLTLDCNGVFAIRAYDARRIVFSASILDTTCFSQIFLSLFAILLSWTLHRRVCIDVTSFVP